MCNNDSWEVINSYLLSLLTIVTKFSFNDIQHSHPISGSNHYDFVSWKINQSCVSMNFEQWTVLDNSFKVLLMTTLYTDTITESVQSNPLKTTAITTISRCSTHPSAIDTVQTTGQFWNAQRNGILECTLLTHERYNAVTRYLSALIRWFTTHARWRHSNLWYALYQQTFWENKRPFMELLNFYS